jgi:plasmid stability protein
MGQVIVRNLSDAVIARLKAKAESHHCSLEQELRLILTDAAQLKPEEKLALIDRIRAMTPGTLADDSAELIRQERDSR